MKEHKKPGKAVHIIMRIWIIVCAFGTLFLLYTLAILIILRRAKRRLRRSDFPNGNNTSPVLPLARLQDIEKIINNIKNKHKHIENHTNEMDEILQHTNTACADIENSLVNNAAVLHGSENEIEKCLSDMDKIDKSIAHHHHNLSQIHEETKTITKKNTQTNHTLENRENLLKTYDKTVSELALLSKK